MQEKLLFYQDALLRYCKHLTSTSDDALDLVQDVNLLALKHQDRCPSNVLAWLFTIAKHAHLNNLKRASLFREAMMQLDTHETPPFSPCMEFYYDLLTSNQRKVFRLFMQGYTLNEIASKMHLSISAVKSTMSRARKTLKSFIATY